MLLPFILVLIFFERGGERSMFLFASLSCTNSLKNILISCFSLGKEVVLSSGITLSTTGGMVSLGPPVGLPLVLAQEETSTT